MCSNVVFNILIRLVFDDMNDNQELFEERQHFLRMMHKMAKCDVYNTDDEVRENENEWKKDVEEKKETPLIFSLIPRVKIRLIAYAVFIVCVFVCRK